MGPTYRSVTRRLDRLTIYANTVSMSDVGAAVRRQQILDAALASFGRYGYRRTSMETIAQAARISRPALYQYFSGKDEVFRAMGVRMLDTALTGADATRCQPAPVADRLYAILALRLDLALGHRTSNGQDGHNAHDLGRELLADAATFAADLLASFQVRLIAIIEELLIDARELDLASSALSAHDVAVVLLDGIAGIERDPAPPLALRLRIRHLVELAVYGLERR